MEAYRTYSEQSDPKKRKHKDVDRQIQNCKFGNGLISNIKEVVVLDKQKSKAADFFRYFELSEIGGKVLVTPNELLTKEDINAGIKGLSIFRQGYQDIFQ